MSEPCTGTPSSCYWYGDYYYQDCVIPADRSSCVVETTIYEYIGPSASGCYTYTSCVDIGQQYCGGCIGACRPTTQTCAQWAATDCPSSPSCNNNGIQDNGETGVDCGGGDCPGCAVNPCSCSWSDQGCGGTPTGGSCQPGQRYQTFTCTGGCSGSSQCVPDSTCPNFNIVRFRPIQNGTPGNPIFVNIDTPFDVRIEGNMDRDPITVALECDWNGVNSNWDTVADFDTERDANISFITDGSIHQSTNTSNVTALCNYSAPGDYTARLRIDRWTQNNKGGTRIRKFETKNVTVQLPVCAPTPVLDDFNSTCDDTSTPVVGEGSVTWNWTIPASYDIDHAEYRLKVFTFDTSIDPDAYVIKPGDDSGYIPATNICTRASRECSYTKTDLFEDDDVYLSIRIRSRTNNVCSGSEPAEPVLGNTIIRSCSANYYNVGGTVYETNNFSLVGGRCVPTGNPPEITKPWQFSITGSASTTTPLQSDGSYVFSNLIEDGNYAVSLDLAGDPDYVQVCPSLTDRVAAITGLSGDVTDLNFIVSQERSGWFQTEGGNVHINRNPDSPATDHIFQSHIPGTCSPTNCNPFVFLNHPADTLSQTAGILTFRTPGDIITSDSSTNSTANLTEGGTAKFLQSSSHSLTFDDLKALYQFPANPALDNDNWNDGQPDQSPANQATGLSAYYFFDDNQSKWEIKTGSPAGKDFGTETVVIFINGNLEISRPINVDQGGFVAYIVSGNITFKSNVGNSDETDKDPNVQGFYFAGGNIITERRNGNPADARFVGEGTFIANQGFTFARDMKEYNDEYPGELFRFRPDLLINLPDQLKRAPFRWSEVAP